MRSHNPIIRPPDSNIRHPENPSPGIGIYNSNIRHLVSNIRHIEYPENPSPNIGISTRLHNIGRGISMRYTYVCIYIFVCVYVYTCAYMCIYLFFYNDAHMSIYLYMYIFVRYVYIHIYIYIYK
jgi:hypothetical protein